MGRKSRMAAAVFFLLATVSSAAAQEDYDAFLLELKARAAVTAMREAGLTVDADLPPFVEGSYRIKGFRENLVPLGEEVTCNNRLYPPAETLQGRQQLLDIVNNDEGNEYTVKGPDLFAGYPGFAGAQSWYVVTVKVGAGSDVVGTLGTSAGMAGDLLISCDVEHYSAALPADVKREDKAKMAPALRGRAAEKALQFSQRLAALYVGREAEILMAYAGEGTASADASCAEIATLDPAKVDRALKKMKVRNDKVAGAMFSLLKAITRKPEFRTKPSLIQGVLSYQTELKAALQVAEALSAGDGVAARNAFTTSAIAYMKPKALSQLGIPYASQIIGAIDVVMASEAELKRQDDLLNVDIGFYRFLDDKDLQQQLDTAPKAAVRAYIGRIREVDNDHRRILQSYIDLMMPGSGVCVYGTDIYCRMSTLIDDIAKDDKNSQLSDRLNGVVYTMLRDMEARREREAAKDIETRYRVAARRFLASYDGQMVGWLTNDTNGPLEILKQSGMLQPTPGAPLDFEGVARELCEAYKAVDRVSKLEP